MDDGIGEFKRARYQARGDGRLAVTAAETASTRRSDLVNVPNLISALRLPIAAAFFAVDGLVARGILLFIGALSDALDGWLARQFRLETRSGAVVDPLFDKLFVTVALAAFLRGPHLGWLEFVILISRDLYVGSGYLASKVLRLDIRPQSRASGKLVTFLQIVTLFVLLLMPESIGIFMVTVAVASAIAILDYTFAGISALRRRVEAA